MTISDQPHFQSGEAPSGPLLRYAAALWWVSLAIIAASLIVIVWIVPAGPILEAAKGWIGGLGARGPVAFGLVYIAAALLFVPGSALTLLAGALLGPLAGTALVSVASTTAAAAAFLIARYLARGAVERLAQRHPRFAAVDEAVGEGGWRVVVLLRLSPAIPYSASNYLFGLTRIGFWPYVLASWPAMLPGTFLYVYLGHIGGAGARGDIAQGRWTLMIIGLLATAALVVYITRLARKKIKSALPSDSGQAEASPPLQRWAVIAGPVLAVLFAALAVGCLLNRDAIRSLGGPPNVTMTEAYAPRSGGPSFDHSGFDALLKKYVDAEGWVNYAGLATDAEKLDQYLASLKPARFESLGRNEKLALLINAYNAFTLRLILDYWDGGKLRSIEDIPTEKRWDDRRWNIGGQMWSPNQIEHEQIRPKFKEPRIHFALVCAAVGCPPLRTEAYVGERIGQQLEAQTQYVHANKTWFRFDTETNTAHLTPLYKWYGGDFEQGSGSALDFAARYADPLRRKLEQGETARIEWLDYDWGLNDVRNKRPR